MQIQYRSKFYVFALLLAICLPLAGAVSPAQAGPSAADKCGQAVLKAMGKCASKAVKTHATCYKKTAAPCFDVDDKLGKAAASASKTVRKKCENTAAVSAAGYGSLSPSSLGSYVRGACVVQGKVLAGRAFGADGSLFNSADKDGQKCLSKAAKTEGKQLDSALKALAKCLGKSCAAGETDTAISEAASDAVAQIDKKCADFAAVAGMSATAFAAAVTGQIPSAVAAPCDALDTTRCAFPFPNDYFSIPGASTPSGRQLALPRGGLPKNSAEQAVDVTRWNVADGFSIGPMLLVNDVNIDLDVTGAAPITDIARSLDADAPVVLLDAETGEKQLLWLERDLRGDTIDDQPIIGRVGRNLKEGHRYIVAMRNMKNGSGEILDPSPGFAIYRDNVPTTLLPIEKRRPHMEEIFTALEGWGIARNELYLAWDFTTQSSHSAAGKLLAMRDDTFDNILGSDAPAFTVDSVVEGVNAKIFRQIDGTFQVPLYLKGGGTPGSSLRLSSLDVPVNDGDYFTAQYRCLIPYAATTAGGAPAVPARASLYGHGLLGSYDEVSAGNVQDMSNEHNIVFCATYWTGFSEEDQDTVIGILQDFSSFPTFIDRQHQGVLDFMVLGRLMIHPDGFTSDAAFQLDGSPLIDTSNLFYDGNSQGGILGGVLAAFEQDAQRFALGVPGMNYSTLLNRSVDFIVFDLVLANYYSNSTDRNLLLSLAQLIWDRTDPSGHINHLLSDPYANTPAKKVLYQVAFGDHQVAPVTVEVAARSNGAYIHEPVLSPGKVVPEVTPYYDIPAIPSYPFDGSAMVVWDSGNPAPPTGNVPPSKITPSDPEWADLGPCPQGHDSDPHSCPRSNADARLQKSEFLKAGGAIIDVCSGAACLAP